MKLFKRTAKQIIGDKGERLASEYLTKKGYLILDTNYKSKKNEIDIVAKAEGTIVFVEVKSAESERSIDFALPSERVTRKKMDCLIACAKDYIADKKRTCSFYRFDVIEVYLNEEPPRIEHIENAFLRKERTYRQ